MRSTLILLGFLLLAPRCGAQGPGDPAYRWFGHDFAFCFITDDGRTSNLAWADTALAMDFRFTIAVNVQRCFNDYPGVLCVDDLSRLDEEGFEIAQHGYSHGFDGLPETCESPYRGSLMGYFMCDDVPPLDAMTSLAAEIERDTFALVPGVDPSDILSVAYPRHRHGKALIDSLISEGYIGARTGGLNDYEMNSFGEFTCAARNSWDGGISIYRVPLAASDRALFGNHSADPPIHYDYETFRTIAQARIDYHKSMGGIMAIYTHHLGNDDDSFGDVNYSDGGMSKQDLAWLADLVRANNGVIMTFRDALTYYRSRTSRYDMDGDVVWVPSETSLDSGDAPEPLFAMEFKAAPNPFNPKTILQANVTTPGRYKLTIHDISGALVSTLANTNLPVGLHSWVWTGIDAQGESRASGLYFAVLAGDTGRSICRLMLIR